MNINNIDSLKYDFIELKEQMNSSNKFTPAKKEIKEELTEKILGNKLLQFVGEKAISVFMDHFCLSIDNENMFTQGVASCCAIFVEKDYKTFLMHISPIAQAEDIFNLLAYLSINRGAHISIFLGPAYEASDTGFNYLELIEKLEVFKNSEVFKNNIVINQLSGEHGNIFVFGRNVYVIEQKEMNANLVDERKKINK